MTEGDMFDSSLSRGIRLELFYLEQEESESGGEKLLYYLLIMQTVVNHNGTSLKLKEI
jgi:hypothetical protein